MLFDYTTNVFCADGSIQSFTDTTTIPDNLLWDGETTATGTYEDLYNRTVKKFAKQAYRTILLAYRDMSMDEFNQCKADNNNFESEGDREIMEKDLTAYAIFGLQDPLRGSIKSSIAECRSAGIATIMCTGDNIDTATAISIDAGIVTEDEINASEESL
jgi:magnesium-transporting ATPase (P-type)